MQILPAILDNTLSIDLMDYHFSYTLFKEFSYIFTTLLHFCTRDTSVIKNQFSVLFSGDCTAKGM
jgi:hypothetical protein